MARNIYGFGGGSTSDVMDALKDGYDTAGAISDNIMRKRAAYRAGPMIARGDYGGAANEYASAGFDTEAQAMRGEHDKAARQAHQDQDREFEAAQKRYDVFKSTLEDLAAVPEGSRAPRLQQRLEAFRQAGYPEDFIKQLAGLDESHLTNDYLRSAGATVDHEWKVQAGQRGGLTAYRQTPGPNGYQIETKTLREPDPAPPGMLVQDENGNWVVNQPYVQARAKVAAATRAPPRARAAPAGGPAHGPALNIDPSQVQWK